MSTLVQTLAPIFGVMVLGYGAARVDAIDQRGTRGLVFFVFTFGIPALLLMSVAGLEVPETFQWGFLVAFYVGSFVAYLLGMVVGWRPFRRPLREQAIFGLGGTFSNLFIVGFPVVLAALGPEATLPMLTIIGFHSVVFLPLTVLLLQAGDPTTSGSGVLRAVFDVLRNPIILSLVFGLVVNVSNMTMWSPLASILDLLGQAAVPCALFAMGASLAGFSLAGQLPESLALTGIKLVAHPLLVWLVAVPIMGLEGLSVSVAVLLAAMPSAVIVYLFGERYSAAAGVAARTVLVSTVLSMATLAAVLLWLEVGAIHSPFRSTF